MAQFSRKVTLGSGRSEDWCHFQAVLMALAYMRFHVVLSMLVALVCTYLISFACMDR